VCGIYGEVRLSGDRQVGRFGERALELIAHRGPDEEGSWAGDGVFLGARRLSIIDLAGGSQPIWNEDRTLAIVYNGELYNFLDLRPELEALGHVFGTRTDTEVVLHAYEQWGPDCLRRLNGMFAFAIWDQGGRSLFLARDRIGEKPLYYRLEPDRLVFGSEIKAILADPDVPREVDLRGLANYLTFGHATAPVTILQDTYKLLPGHYLLVRDGAVQTHEYWDLGADGPAGEGGTDPVAGIRSLLADSVRRRLVADVPVGAFLSGGVDSSAVVALMQRYSTERVRTFSIGFTVGGAYDERADARRVAEHLGTEHHELLAEHVDLVETLRTLVHHYDEPFADPAGFPLYLLSRFARERVKVVLTGDGGDELFGGYRRYAADQLSPAYRHLPGPVRDRWIPGTLGALPRLRRLKRAARTLGVADPARRYAGWLEVFTPDMRAELLRSDVIEALGGYDPVEPYDRLYAKLDGATDHLNRLMYVDVKTWLADAYMEKTDKATMACSLEARLPILDHRLVELAFQIPGAAKIKGWSTKRIWKQAVRGLVPDAVLRKRKHGFAVPTDPWFRGDLRAFAFDVLMDERARRRGYINMPVLERLWKEHASGRHVWDEQLWVLLNLELWHQVYLDRVPV
jgi:asparagine synthase (glutamine-hydrolysing)